jgi:hypothetical protein
MNPTKRSELHRIPVRGSHDWDAIARILDVGFLAHVGLCVSGQTFVIPTLSMDEREAVAVVQICRDAAEGQRLAPAHPADHTPRRRAWRHFFVQSAREQNGRGA